MKRLQYEGIEAISEAAERNLVRARGDREISNRRCGAQIHVETHRFKTGDGRLSNVGEHGSKSDERHECGRRPPCARRLLRGRHSSQRRGDRFGQCEADVAHRLPAQLRIAPEAAFDDRPQCRGHFSYVYLSLQHFRQDFGGCVAGEELLSGRQLVERGDRRCGHAPAPAPCRRRFQGRFQPESLQAR